jgi:hypothetical protein
MPGRRLQNGRGATTGFRRLPVTCQQPAAAPRRTAGFPNYDECSEQVPGKLTVIAGKVRFPSGTPLPASILENRKIQMFTFHVFGGHLMIKFVLPAVMAIAFSVPAAAQAFYDGCCPQADCCQRQKRFEVCCVTREVCRLKRVCVTDECGCSRYCLKRVPVTVTRKRLVRVDRGCGCMADCGCGCGCDSVPGAGVPVMAPVPADATGG